MYFKEKVIDEKLESPSEITHPFSELEGIDSAVAKSLVEHGYDSIEKVNKASLKDLTKIKGISKKTAQQIKSECEEFEVWESYSPDDAHTVPIDSAPHKEGEYTLYKKETKRLGKKKITYSFSKETPKDGQPTPLPAGYTVKVDKKTGVPSLEKKK